MNHRQKILIRNGEWPLEACIAFTVFEGRKLNILLEA